LDEQNNLKGIKIPFNHKLQRTRPKKCKSYEGKEFKGNYSNWVRFSQFYKPFWNLRVPLSLKGLSKIDGFAQKLGVCISNLK